MFKFHDLFSFSLLSLEVKYLEIIITEEVKYLQVNDLDVHVYILLRIFCSVLNRIGGRSGILNTEY